MVLLVFVVAGLAGAIFVVLESAFGRDGRGGGAGETLLLMFFRSSGVEALVATVLRRVGGTGGGVPRFDVDFDVSG